MDLAALVDTTMAATVGITKDITRVVVVEEAVAAMVETVMKTTVMVNILALLVQC